MADSNTIIGNALYSDQDHSSLTGAETTINTATGLLLTFTNIGAQVFPQAQEAVLDMAAAMYQGNINTENLRTTSIQLGKALNDPIKGLNSLRRVGVAFTSQQKLMINALANTGNLAKAQKVILAELRKEFGDQASIESYNKKMRELDTALGNVAKRIGAELRPAVETIVVKLTDFANAFDESKIIPFVQIMATSVLGIRLFAKGLGLALIAQVRHVKSVSRMVKVGKLAIFNFFGLSSAVRKASFAIRGLTVATKAMTGPLGWILLAAEGLFLLKGMFKDTGDSADGSANSLAAAEATLAKFDEVTKGTMITASGYAKILKSLGIQFDRFNKDAGYYKGLLEEYRLTLVANVEATKKFTNATKDTNKEFVSDPVADMIESY